MLLSDDRMKKFLTEDVVPSWEKVRDVPKVTIDFGNGKVLKRTLKGNTVMYLCTPDGKAVDAFPGVYTPEDFLPLARAAVKELGQRTEPEVLAWHVAKASLARRRGAETTVGKGAVESPLLPEKAPPTSRGKATMQSALLSKGAEQPIGFGKGSPYESAFEAAAASLEDLSKRPMSAREAIRLATGKEPGSLSPQELGERAVRLDSQINVQFVRPVIHLWFASMRKLPTPTSAKDAMFEKILHIPYKDPYLGLTDIELPGTPNGRS